MNEASWNSKGEYLDGTPAFAKQRKKNRTNQKLKIDVLKFIKLAWIREPDIPADEDGEDEDQRV